MRFKTINPLPLLRFLFILLLFVNTQLQAQKQTKALYTKEVYFEFNKWDIRPEDNKTLAAVLRAIKAQKEPHFVTITGHTDNVDNDKYNLQLGMKRAQTIAQYLIKRGVDSSLLQLYSLGEKKEKLSNETDSARLLNRRVEISIFKDVESTKQGNEIITTPSNAFLTVVMIDSITRQPLKGQVMVEEKTSDGRTPQGTITLDTSSITSAITKGSAYTLSFSSKGFRTKNVVYTFADSIFRQGFRRFDTIALTKAKIKRKVSFEKIYFYGNEARFLPSSGGELARVLQLAKAKDVSAIEIIGHVNHPYHFDQLDTNQVKFNYYLSFIRAKAVNDYLVNNGVSQIKITFKGVANTEMKFPMARQENEMQMNRRVEVLVLEE